MSLGLNVNFSVKSWLQIQRRTHHIAQPKSSAEERMNN